jgi:hypothetical protein
MLDVLDALGSRFLNSILQIVYFNVMLVSAHLLFSFLFRYSAMAIRVTSDGFTPLLSQNFCNLSRKKGLILNVSLIPWSK